MEVTTNSARAIISQKMSIELLLADVPETSYTRIQSLTLGQADGSRQTAISFAAAACEDASHPAIDVHLDACIQCTRCVRACREAQVNDVIGYAFRGGQSKIVFDLDDPMGESTCVACGECVQACPTGALTPARGVATITPESSVDSVCPYCGVGCQLTYHVKENRILYVQGKDGPSNSSRLCVKGRYGFDYVQHRHRLTKPLIRKPGVPKHKNLIVDPENWQELFREATWEEALDVAARGLLETRARYGKRALAGFGQRKERTRRRTCFRSWCAPASARTTSTTAHACATPSSVAALMEGLNSGAVSNQVRDVAHAESFS
jgi:formate dehydrogenase major subunit